jgi:parallel beta-helix repeat protein
MIAEWYNGQLTFLPFQIWNNADFLALGFPGSGTESDPYILEGMEITSGSGRLIEISNTNVHFILRNNVLNGYGTADDGIFLENLPEGIIEGNLIHDISNGITLQNSLNLFIENNDIFNCVEGIQLVSTSSYNIIVGNNLHESGDGLIVLSDSNYNNITGNEFSFNTNGINIQFGSDFNVVHDNKFNGNFGWGVWVYDSTENQISHNELSNQPLTGINLEANGNHVFSNHIYRDTLSGDGSTGIHVIAQNNEIYDNVIERYEFGILSDGFGPNLGANKIKNNHFIDNVNGILVVEDNGDNVISFNQFENNGFGLSVNSDSNSITDNWFVFNNDAAFDFGSESAHNHISFNDFANNAHHTQGIDHGTNNDFTANFWSHNVGPDNDRDGLVDGPTFIDGSAQNQDISSLVWPNNPSEIDFISYIDIISPTAGEPVSGDVRFEWTSGEDSFGHTITFSLYFVYTSDQPFETATRHEIVSETSQLFYNWDSTTVDDGEIMVLLVANAEGEHHTEFLMPAEIIVDNLPDGTEPPTSTTTTEISSSDEKSEDDPTVNYPGIGFFVILPIGVYLFKRKKYYNNK